MQKGFMVDRLEAEMGAEVSREEVSTRQCNMISY